MYLIVIESAASHKQVQLLQKALTDKGLDVLVVCSSPVAIYELAQPKLKPHPIMQSMLQGFDDAAKMDKHLVVGADFGIVAAEVAELKKPGELSTLQEDWSSLVKGMPMKFTTVHPESGEPFIKFVQPQSAMSGPQAVAAAIKQGGEFAAADFFNKLAELCSEPAQPITPLKCPHCGSPELAEEGTPHGSFVCASCGKVST